MKKEKKKEKKRQLYSLEWYSDLLGLSIASGYIVATSEDDAQERAIDDVFDMVVRSDALDPERDATECFVCLLNKDTTKRILDRVRFRKAHLLEDVDDLIRVEIDLEEVLR